MRNKGKIKQDTILIVVGLIVAAYLLSKGNYFTVNLPPGWTPWSVWPPWNGQGTATTTTTTVAPGVPPSNPPSGGTGYTASECSGYASGDGKTYSALKATENDCANYVNNYCGNVGMEGWYDYVSNCCVFNCEPLQQTDCHTYCTSHGMLLIQSGQWTESQCYDSAIYVCNGLQHLDMSMINDDGACCCYKCN